ncbi:MAG: hypothetical protein FWC43_11520 [Planctomycetaceae bacterium]|nr:hypothetical protein [Planctomycetaceae bacterium]
MSLTTLPSSPILAIGEQDFSLFPISSELTVSQAAKMIDVPEGYIDELLKAGFVTFRLKNGERLVQRDSLLEHESEYQRGLKGLAEITRMSQEMGLYD